MQYACADSQCDGHELRSSKPGNCGVCGKLMGPVFDPPKDIIRKIFSFTDQTSKTKQSLSLVNKKFANALLPFGVSDQLWYGMSSSTRLDSYLSPFELRVIQLGQFQEGPCRKIAEDIVDFIFKNSTDRKLMTMLGVLGTECGRILITMSGTMSMMKDEGLQKIRMLREANLELLDGRALVVVAGCVGDIVDSCVLDLSTVKAFHGNFLKGTLYPAGQQGKEEAETIPGTCALPKLLDYCRMLKMVPRFVSEVFVSLRDTSIVVRSWNGELVRHFHGDAVPSCLNCRNLVPLMLNGLDVFKNERVENELLEKLREEYAEKQRIYLEQARQQEEQERSNLEQSHSAELKSCVLKILDLSSYQLIDVYLDETIPNCASGLSAQFLTLSQYTGDPGAVLAKKFITHLKGELFRLAYSYWKESNVKPSTKRRGTSISPAEAFENACLEVLGEEPTICALVEWFDVLNSPLPCSTKFDFEASCDYIEQIILHILAKAPDPWDPKKPEKK